MPYPNFSEGFIIHTDPKKCILGEYLAKIGSPFPFSRVS